MKLLDRARQSLKFRGFERSKSSITCDHQKLSELFLERHLAERLGYPGLGGGGQFRGVSGGRSFRNSFRGRCGASGT